jgi:hypothetical protein
MNFDEKTATICLMVFIWTLLCFKAGYEFRSKRP